MYPGVPSIAPVFVALPVGVTVIVQQPVWPLYPDRLGKLGDAEVEQLHVPVGGDEDVLRLHVAVDDSSGVGRGQPSRQLGTPLQRQWRGMRPRPEAIPE